MYVVDQSKQCARIYLQKIACCLNFAVTNIIFLVINRLLKTCIFIKRTCISIFSKIEFVDQSKPCTQIYLHNFASCINLQLPKVTLKKKNSFRYMHHHKPCMYMNIQQNQVKTQVMTVHTSLFAKNRKLHKFATNNSNFEKMASFRHALSLNVHDCQFSAKLGK